MARRSLVEERVRAAISGACLSSPTPEAFGAAVLPAMHELVPYDSARMFGIDPGSLLLNRLIAATATDEPYRGYWLRHIYLAGADDGYFAPHHLLREGEGAVVYLPRQDDCWGLGDRLRARFSAERHTSYFHESLTPIGGSMRMGLRARGQWIGMIDLARREAGRPYTATEFASARELVSLIGQGLDRLLLREAAADSVRTAPYGSGVIYISANREILLQTPAAEAYLEALFDRGGSGPDDLSTPLAALVSAFLSPARHSPAQVVTVASRVGPLRVEATAGQCEGEVAIVIAPTRATATVQAPAHWRLTQRQREIVELVLQGSSTKEIARKLSIGVPTVETHLGHIYGELGVNGRHELIARYFQTVIRPQID